MGVPIPSVLLPLAEGVRDGAQGHIVGPRVRDAEYHVLVSLLLGECPLAVAHLEERLLSGLRGLHLHVGLHLAAEPVLDAHVVLEPGLLVLVDQ